MHTFTHVEDYLEVIAGYRNPETNKLTTTASTLWMGFEPIISLARYDVSVIESMAESAIGGKGLTTKQAELAAKIIIKYQRQLAQKNIDVTPVLEPVWRIPLRVLDYSKRMYIEDDTIMVEFPFNNSLIDGLREFRKDSQGKGEWNKDKRRWEFALTEYNVAYLVTWGNANQFEIDAEFTRLNAMIFDIEKTPYAIELDIVDEKVQIKNGSESLIEYINTNCGGLTIDNLANLVDMSPILAYTISEDIKLAWQEQHGDLNVFLGTHNAGRLPHDQYELIAEVMDYADQVKRWPMVVYEPDTSNKLLGQMCNFRDRGLVHMHRGKNSIDPDKIPEGVKYIHTTVPIKNIKIPLLVSTAGMMFGGDKSLMLQNAEKAVYFAADVHTNKKDNKVASFASETNNQG